MNQIELKNIIAACLDDVLFTHNGKRSGVTSEVKNSIPTFQAWHGSATKEYDNIDNLMEDKFFSGKSLVDLLGVVEFTFA